MNDAVNFRRRQLLLALAALPLGTPHVAFATGSAPRVASLSWAGAQILVALGLDPVAITERGNYVSFDTRPAMPAGTVELGLHSEPNLELLQALKPDFLIIDTDQTGLTGRLESIAPTLTVDIYNPALGKPYARAALETLRIGTALGREREAHAHLAEQDAQIAQNAQVIAGLGSMPPVLIADLYDDGRHLYVYGPNSMMQDVLERLNVRNAWHGSTSSGFLLMGIEELASQPDAQMFYIDRGLRNRIAFHNLQRSVLWNHLPFVQAKRIAPLPGFFTYGATACAAQFAAELTAGLVALDRAAGARHG